MSNRLRKIAAKKSRKVIGLLSGTSVDSVDAVLLNITGSGTQIKLKVLDFISLQIPKAVRAEIFRNSDKKTAQIEEICRLNVILGGLFADTVLKLLKKRRLRASEVDLIGSHGQTIHHLPGLTDYLGYRVNSTLQIADPSVIANLTGITTVGDFRIADCSVGGEGAPLVPYLDLILFTHKSKNRALLNIGGIANITVLKKNARKFDVTAFDTGPGNMIIDGLMYHLYKKPYDKNGGIAKKGVVIPELICFMADDKYYLQKPPKSTGREHYGKAFQLKLLKKIKGIKKPDVIRTVTEFTAYSIWYNYKNFISAKTKVDELIISGGGAKNPVLMKSIRSYFKGVKVTALNSFGINTKNKEAVLFAVLANECISGKPANMTTVTGSGRDVILGKICPVL